MVLSLKYKISPMEDLNESDHRCCLEDTGSQMEELLIQACHDVILQHKARACFDFLRYCSSKVVHQNVRL